MPPGNSDCMGTEPEALKTDKLADLIVLSNDPFEIPVDALKDVQVDLTVVGGRVVHQGRA